MNSFQTSSNLPSFWSIYWCQYCQIGSKTAVSREDRVECTGKIVFFHKGGVMCVCVCGVYWSQHRKGAHYDKEKEKVLGYKGSGGGCLVASSGLFAFLVYHFSSCKPWPLYSLLQKFWLPIQCFATIPLFSGRGASPGFEQYPPLVWSCNQGKESLLHPTSLPIIVPDSIVLSWVWWLLPAVSGWHESL